MNNKPPYNDYYKILSCSPGCNWDSLRKAYKRQIQKWHPDKFTDNPQKKKLAEEKITRINNAYQQLSDHYKKYGSLPEIADLTDNPAPDSNTTKPAAGRTSRPEKPIPKPTTVKIPSKTPIVITLSSLLIALLTIAIFDDSSKPLSPEPGSIKHNSTNNKPGPDTTTTSEQKDSISYFDEVIPTNINHDKKDSEETDTQDEEELFITEGSTISDVITAQGMPDKIENDIWYYGESEIHFQDGVVVNWVRATGFPIKVKIDISQFRKKNN